MSEVSTEQTVPTGVTQTTVVADQKAEVDEVLQALLGKITPLEDMSKSNLKVLVFSDPDGGKTTFAGTADNNLFIDAEDGLTSLKNNPQLIGKGSKRMPYVNFPVFERTIDYIADRNPAFDWVETITIDTLSELHKKGLAETVEREHARSPLLVNKYNAETEHHSENNEHIRRLVSTLKDIDRNLIILAHSRKVEDKKRGTLIYPDFSEKLATAIVALVDICIYIEKREIDGEVKRVFRFHTDSSIMTKSRIGGLPDEAVDVTWSSLWTKFQAHLAQEAKSNQ